MAKVIIGNASAITVPRKDRDSIREFYGDVLGGKIVKEGNEKDIFRLEEEFYILFRYGDVPDESEFLRYDNLSWARTRWGPPPHLPNPRLLERFRRRDGEWRRQARGATNARQVSRAPCPPILDCVQHPSLFPVFIA